MVHVDCPCCERHVPEITWRRRNTAYADDECNWFLACPECHEIDFEYYQERRLDYWQSVW
jgi:hypothetical protein